MGKTTVVIPNYNGMKFIEECLRSLTNQTKMDYDILIVDNGSTDGSKEWILEHYPQITLYAFAQNKGFCSAVNFGMKQSESEYVILLNNDTSVKRDFVEQMEQVMDTHQDCFSASAKMLEMQRPDILDGAGDFYCALGWAYARGKGRPESEYNKETQIFSSCAGAAIYRKKLLVEIGYFDENHFAYLEDVDIGYRAGLFGYQNRFAPKAVVRHAGSGASGSRYNEFKITLSSKNSIYLIYKNMPLLQILINLPFFIIGFLGKTLFFIKKGYGQVYIKGLKEGILFCTSQKAKAHKIKYCRAHFKHYLRIQIQLWKNIICRS